MQQTHHSLLCVCVRGEREVGLEPLIRAPFREKQLKSEDLKQNHLLGLKYLSRGAILIYHTPHISRL